MVYLSGFSIFALRLKKQPSTMLFGGICAVLALTLLVGFVPEREIGELRLPLHSGSFLVEKNKKRPNTRPLDTTVWMVRLPLENKEPDTMPDLASHRTIKHMAHIAQVSLPFSKNSVTKEPASIKTEVPEFYPDAVSHLTEKNIVKLPDALNHNDLFHILQRETYGLPAGIALDHTAVVDGKYIPSCVQTHYATNSKNIRESWLKRQSLPYFEHIRPWIRRFGLNRDLVYAIMFTESGFNPRAISNKGARGLMQIMAETAGGEVHSYLFGKKGRPNKEDLLNPDINIQYGTTYLHLLLTRHFGLIKNPLSKEYCAVAAYNGGPGAVLNLFGKKREEALANINSYSPHQLYNFLQERLPSDETRHFLHKVMSLKNGVKLAMH